MMKIIVWRKESRVESNDMVRERESAQEDKGREFRGKVSR